VVGGLSSRTRFWDFGQVILIGFARFFLPSFTRFLAIFMVDITYVTISSYKYTSKLHNFLTPSSHILLLTLSPINLLLFLVFGFLHFGVKRGQSMVKRGRSWGSKRPID